MTQSGENSSKELLESLLAELYRQQAGQANAGSDSYLEAADGQYLGRITENNVDRLSILNEFGPYGSPYSPTSIWNPFSPYGSEYGQYSLNNPHAAAPPKLVIHGQVRGRVSQNPYVDNRIATDDFINILRKDIHSLLQGEPTSKNRDSFRLAGKVYIQGNDGTFLGNLHPNRYDQESIFNRYGPYGSKYSPACIFNRYGNYGNRYSTLSPFNRMSGTPPRIIAGDQMVAYLTVNPRMKPRVDPNEIMQWASEKVPPHPA